MTLSCVDSIGIVTCQITDNKKTGNSISAIPLTLRREGVSQHVYLLTTIAERGFIEAIKNEGANAYLHPLPQQLSRERDSQ